jgi:hypothetical protein
MKADASIQSFGFPFGSPFDFRPPNSRITRRQIKALLVYPAGVLSSQKIGKFETLFAARLNRS